MKKQLGDFILSAIEMKNETQKDIAEHLNLAPQTLNSYILNKRTPDVETLSSIMRYLGMDANRALGIEPDIANMIQSREEAILIRNFRLLDEEHQDFVTFMLAKLPKKEENHDIEDLDPQ